MMTILLTGGAGFIGSRTAQMLLDRGVQVIIADNLNDYYDVRLKEYRLKCLLENANAKFEELDIEDMDSLRKLFSAHRIDSIINLAARAGVRYSIENPHVYVTTNVSGTLNLLELMREHSIAKIVLASSSSIYAGNPMPFNEELSTSHPISPYAASKTAAELLAYTYHYLFELDVTVLRYFTVYGPAGRPDMCYFRFIKWIDEGHPLELFGDGSQGRDFTYVDDIADGTIRALRNVGYEIINLGGGNNPIEINYMIAKIEEFLGKDAIIEYRPFEKTDMKQTWADIAKAEKILDWQPTIAFDDGLKRTVDWYLDNRDWLSDIKL